MARYVLLLLVINVCYFSYTNSLPTQSLNLFNGLISTCKIGFISEQLKSRLQECSNPMESYSEKHLQCLMFYDINSQICNRTSFNEDRLRDLFTANLVKTQSITTFCDVKKNWKFSHNELFPQYKSYVEYIFNNGSSHLPCIKTCSTGIVLNIDTNFYCKYFAIGNEIRALLETSNISNSPLPFIDNQENNSTRPTINSTAQNETGGPKLFEKTSTQASSSVLPKHDSNVVIQKPENIPYLVSKPAEASVGNIKPAEASVSNINPAEASVSNIKPSEASVSNIKPAEAPVSNIPADNKMTEENHYDASVMSEPKGNTAKLEIDNNKNNGDQNIEDKGSVIDNPNHLADNDAMSPQLDDNDDQDSLPDDVDGDFLAEHQPQPDTETTLLSSRNKDIKVPEEYNLQEGYNEDDDHFIPLFFTAIVMVALLYILYHNKSKVTKVILGLIVEGRQPGRRRDSRGHAYRRLDTLEQAMNTNLAAPPSKIIY